RFGRGPGAACGLGENEDHLCALVEQRSFDDFDGQQTEHRQGDRSLLELLGARWRMHVCFREAVPPEEMAKVARRAYVSGRGFARLLLLFDSNLGDCAPDRLCGIRVDRLELPAHLGRGGLEELEKAL